MNSMADLYRHIKKLEDENTRLLAASRGMVETIARQELEIVRHKREIENYRRLIWGGAATLGPALLN